MNKRILQMVSILALLVVVPYVNADSSGSGGSSSGGDFFDDMGPLASIVASELVSAIVMASPAIAIGTSGAMIEASGGAAVITSVESVGEVVKMTIEVSAEGMDSTTGASQTVGSFIMEVPLSDFEGSLQLSEAGQTFLGSVNYGEKVAIPVEITPIEEGYEHNKRLVGHSFKLADSPVVVGVVPNELGEQLYPRRK